MRTPARHKQDDSATVIGRGDLASAIKLFRAEAHPDRHGDVSTFETWCDENDALSVEAELYLQNAWSASRSLDPDAQVRESLQRALDTLDIDGSIAARDEQLAKDAAMERVEAEAIDSRWKEIEAAFETAAHRRSNAQAALVAEMGVNAFLREKNRRVRDAEARYKASFGYKLDEFATAVRGLLGVLIQILSVLVWIAAFGLTFITLWAGVPAALLGWILWKVGRWLKDAQR
jgi:hypothetical protein